MSRAFSTFKIKSVTDTAEERIITGIASTPTPDRDSDVIDPKGAKFALPIPLLWQHNHNQPIGEVVEATVTDAGIEITAKIATITDEGALKNRIDEAWQSIKSGLVKCLSVGFRSLDYAYHKDDYGLDIKEWEWYELSVVTVPANPDAIITSLKDFKKAFADGASHSPALGVKTQTTPPQPPKTAPVGVTTGQQKPTYVTLVDPNKGGVKLL